MNEDFASRAWAEHHRHVVKAFQDFRKAAGEAFEHLTREQFRAPWDERREASRPCAD